MPGLLGVIEPLLDAAAGRSTLIGLGTASSASMAVKVRSSPAVHTLV
jgi:hypothetical protein